MADTYYDVTSGFYDSVDKDRLYSADQMNMPYKRIICEGVFATPEGTASTDFQVMALSDMNVKVCAGNAMLGEKWLELEADQNITISGNSSANPRIDSIILRVDRNMAGRKAQIAYRQGTAASTPTAPALDTSTNIYEIRLANIEVASNAYAITQSMITDMRGSAECPWITSLIYQVDTSTLFEQWRAAYEEAFERNETQWQEFFEQLTQELTLQTSIVTQTGSLTTKAGDTFEISLRSFGITDFRRENCELMVFINGLYAEQDNKWQLAYDPLNPEAASILFANDLSAGQDIYVVMVKSIVTGNATTLLEELSNIETRLNSVETSVRQHSTRIATLGNVADLSYTTVKEWEEL